MHQERMLPRNLPKHGNFLVNPTPKFSGIELEIELGELRFGVERNVFAFADSLARGLGGIKAFAGLVAKTFLSDQFQGGLKEVEVKS